MEFGQMDNVEIEGCRQTASFELKKFDVTILAKASEDKEGGIRLALRSFSEGGREAHH
jgi:hypothetical protein